jgi:hypothetical protein
MDHEFSPPSAANDGISLGVPSNHEISGGGGCRRRRADIENCKFRTTNIVIRSFAICNINFVKMDFETLIMYILPFVIFFLVLGG